jgi:hypothetical protein
MASGEQNEDVSLLVKAERALFEVKYLGLNI